ncbi:MAG: hypothetical protein R6W31_20405 [Bacteroidales bacterium]
MTQEHEYIKKCLNLIEGQFQWGPRKDWTTYNYSRLSLEVKEASGITLSTRTLRRLCSNYKGYKPQTATKNALSIFLGYKDWEDFKNQQTGSRITNGKKVQPRTNFRSFMHSAIRSVWTYIILLLGVALVAILLFYPRIKQWFHTNQVEFTSNYVIGTAPQRVTFYYDVSKINSTNLFINKNFYEDGDIIPINKNRHYFTSDFELPDHYSVKILANGERISCIRIHVITNGWEGVINGQHVGRIDNSHRPGILAYHPDTIANNTSPDFDNVLEFRNIREFGILGDNMKLEAELRNIPDSLFSDCLESTIQIINLHGRVGFDFVKPGCPSSMLNAEFGDVLLNGEFQDMDSFYQDFSDWRTVAIEVRDKRIHVSLEGKEIYSVKYTDPLDEVKGLVFKFKGVGEINYVKLFDGGGELVYEDQF